MKAIFQPLGSRRGALLGAALLLTVALRAESALAAGLFSETEGKFLERRAALEKIVAADPNNAAACYQLGIFLRRRTDADLIQEAVAWLAKAVDLDPNNATYLAEFGSASLELAENSRSFATVNRGREALERLLTIDPDHLTAREELYQFYAQAPRPADNGDKAAAQLAKIRERDPDRAIRITVVARNFPVAFTLCDEVLAKTPDNYNALYHYGRAAALSGQHLARGLAMLRKCLVLDRPSPGLPGPASVWMCIRDIHQRLNQPNEARAAYETALKLDPSLRAVPPPLSKRMSS